MTDWLKGLKEAVWPTDRKERSVRKAQLFNIGLFVSSTVVLIKYGRKLADTIYNQAFLEETIRNSL